MKIMFFNFLGGKHSLCLTSQIYLKTREHFANMMNDDETNEECSAEIVKCKGLVLKCVY